MSLIEFIDISSVIERQTGSKDICKLLEERDQEPEFNLLDAKFVICSQYQIKAPDLVDDRFNEILANIDFTKEKETILTNMLEMIYEFMHKGTKSLYIRLISKNNKLLLDYDQIPEEHNEDIINYINDNFTEKLPLPLKSLILLYNVNENNIERYINFSRIQKAYIKPDSPQFELYTNLFTKQLIYVDSSITKKPDNKYKYIPICYNLNNEPFDNVKNYTDNCILTIVNNDSQLSNIDNIKNNIYLVKNNEINIVYVLLQDIDNLFECRNLKIKKKNANNNSTLKDIINNNINNETILEFGDSIHKDRLNILNNYRDKLIELILKYNTILYIYTYNIYINVGGETHPNKCIILYQYIQKSSFEKINKKYYTYIINKNIYNIYSLIYYYMGVEEVYNAEISFY